MKSFLITLKSHRWIHGTLLAFLLAAAAAAIGWSNSQPQMYKFEGAWTVSGMGLIANCTFIPVEPSGQHGCLRNTWVTVGPIIATLFGEADAVTDGVGEYEVKGRIAKYTQVFNYVKQGVPNELKWIWLDTGTLTFTSPTTAVNNNSFSGYAPSRDANHDGIPDDLENPPDVGPFEGEFVLTRIPTLH
jgi:hypothetical protein